MTDYPRPQLRRTGWHSLDGMWRLNGQPIRVPYPPEAPLSGWRGEVPTQLVYERSFDLPEDLRTVGRRTILHFGAVDQTARVYLNGCLVCAHEGGYLPFCAYVSDLLRERGNELRVEAEDRLLRRYPYGKQSRKPHGMWYTPFSGIWQTVWLEQVPDAHITGLRLIPDLSGLTLTVLGSPAAQGMTVEACIDGEAPVSMQGGQTLRLPVSSPRLWTPEDPYLYPLELRLGEDRVQSYFALRTVSVSRDSAGGPVIALNGKPLFLAGLLDQGYYPGGWSSPVHAEDYERDIMRARELGFNTLRKHIKLEPEAFYYACDRLGMLVIQDMVNSGPYFYLRDTVLTNLGLKRHVELPFGDRQRKRFFEEHCEGIQDRLAGHPSVILYTLFNEGWGQYETSRVYRRLKAHDPSRLYISSSGWYKGYETDIDTEHVYFRNRVLRRRRRPLLLTECGGYAFDADSGAREAYGYGSARSAEELTERFAQLFREMVLPSVGRGLNGVIYTQLTDVEGEINGLYSFDRKRCKVIPERIRAILREAYERFRREV